MRDVDVAVGGPHPRAQRVAGAEHLDAAGFREHRLARQEPSQQQQAEGHAVRDRSPAASSALLHLPGGDDRLARIQQRVARRVPRTARGRARSGEFRSSNAMPHVSGATLLHQELHLFGDGEMQTPVCHRVVQHQRHVERNSVGLRASRSCATTACPRLRPAQSPVRPEAGCLFRAPPSRACRPRTAARSRREDPRSAIGRRCRAGDLHRAAHLAGALQHRQLESVVRAILSQSSISILSPDESMNVSSAEVDEHVRRPAVTMHARTVAAKALLARRCPFRR